jgi:TetR/AcrR family tetracycline transcriptional repressor
VVDFVNGFVLGEVSSLPAQSDIPRELRRRVEAQPDESLPTVCRVFAALGEDKAPYDFDTGFDKGITIILRGSRASRTMSPTPNLAAEVY